MLLNCALVINPLCIVVGLAVMKCTLGVETHCDSIDTVTIGVARECTCTGLD